MKKTMYEALASMVIDTVNRIDDPSEKADKLYNFMTLFNYSDCEMEVNENTGEIVGIRKIPEKPEEEMPPYIPTASNVTSLPSENDAPPAASKHEEKAKTSEEKAEAVKAKLEAADVLTLPTTEDSEETASLRRATLAKKYGDVTIEKAFNDPEISKYLVAEMDAMSEFKEKLLECFEIEVREGADGELEYVSKGEVSVEQIDSLIHHFIHEADESAEDYTKVKLDKFLTKFVPYMAELHAIFSYTQEQIANVGKEAMDGKEDFSVADIDIYNAKALRLVLEDRYNH